MNEFLDSLRDVIAELVSEVTFLKFEIKCLKARLEKLEENDGTTDEQNSRS